MKYTGQEGLAFFVMKFAVTGFVGFIFYFSIVSKIFLIFYVCFILVYLFA